jgi:hypothetical protein
VSLHGKAEPGVVTMLGIGAAIAVAEEPAFNEPVVIRTVAVLDRRGGRDSEGQLGQDRGLEDPLRTDQGDTRTFEVATSLEDRARKGGLAEAAALLGEEVEGA